MNNDLIIQTVARNFLTKVATAALLWAAGFLLSHGLATDDQVKQAIDPVVQIIVGAAMTGLGLLIVWIRSKMKRQKEQSLLVAKPIDVTVKGA